MSFHKHRFSTEQISKYIRKCGNMQISANIVCAVNVGFEQMNLQMAA